MLSSWETITIDLSGVEWNQTSKKVIKLNCYCCTAWHLRHCSTRVLWNVLWNGNGWNSNFIFGHNELSLENKPSFLNLPYYSKDGNLEMKVTEETRETMSLFSIYEWLFCTNSETLSPSVLAWIQYSLILGRLIVPHQEIRIPWMCFYQ